MDLLTILEGDATERLRSLETGSVQCAVTSPPYWGLRNYGVEGQLGLEKTPEEYVAKLVAVFREVRRVLKDDGTLWLNLGDSYASAPAGNFGPNMPAPADGGRYRENEPKMDYGSGIKMKDLCGIPWMVAFALRADGWYLRSDIIWSKPNPMPESVTDRPTKAHEYLFLLSKSQRYYYDAAAINEPLAESTANDSRLYDENYKTGRPERGFPGQASNGSGLLKRKSNPDRNDLGASMRSGGTLAVMRNKRSVWNIATAPYPDAHFATYPPDLIKPCILAGSKHGDTILDPFGGSGTTGMVGMELGRKALLIELNPEYISLINQRTNVTPGLAFA